MPEKALKTLLSISRIDLEKPLNQILGEILTTVGQEIGGHSGSMMLVNEETGELEMVATFGLPRDYIEQVSRKEIPITNSPSGEVLRTGEFYVVPNIFEESRDKWWADLGRELGFSAQLFMPMKHKGEIIGLLNIQMAEPHKYTQNEIAFVSIAASQAAAVIENARLYAKIDKEKAEMESEITEHKRVEELLWESKEILNDILSASPIGIGIVKDRKLSWTNERMLEMMGFKPDDDPHDYVGKSAEVIYASKEEYERVGQIFYNELRRSNLVEIDAKLKRKDGSLFDGHIKMCFLDPSNPVKGAIATISDISWRKQAEEKLRESEEKYCTLTETVTDVIFTVDTESKFAYVSPQCEEIVGFTEQDLLGRSFTEVLAPEYIESTVNRFKKGIAGEDGPLYEIELLHKDGRRVPVELNTTSLLDFDGQTIGRLGVARDIGERKRMEEKLRESEKWYRTLIQSSSDIIFVLDETGTIRYMSPSVERIVGYKPEDMIGKNGFSYYHPEDIPALHAAFTGLAQQAGVTATAVVRALHKDGSAVYLEVVGENLLSDPQIRGVVGHCRDITERKRAEKTLQEREERFRSLFDNLSIGMAMIDREGRILAANKTVCHFLDYSQEELIGRPLTELIYPEDLNTDRDLFDSIIKGENDHCLMDKRCVRKDSEIVWGRLHVSGIMDEEGYVKYMSVICDDITACKLVEKALVSKSTEMAGVVANCKHMKEALKRSEQKYKEIADFLPDLIYKSIMLEA